MTQAEGVIRRRVAPGSTLCTLTRRRPFVIEGIDAQGVVLLLGERRTRTVIPWAVLQDLMVWLATQDWVEVGGRFTVRSEGETVDALLKHEIPRTVANYVAALLVRTDLAETDHGRPLRIRYRS
ncbi:MAG TPA: hypothetical protein VIA06_14920 [Candidatus Dormibacteraeota bacterium]|nr:hypothetical protein [Candidatus Dormibacteraeota bacterium]